MQSFSLRAATAIAICVPLIGVMFALGGPPQNPAAIPSSPQTIPRTEPQEIPLPVPPPALPDPNTPSPATMPPVTPIPESVPSAMSDPLFHEIQRLLLNQGSSLGKSSLSSPSNGVTADASELDALSSERWHAIEHILVAARILESEQVRQLRAGDLESARTTAETVRSLRRQAVALLSLSR